MLYQATQQRAIASVVVRPLGSLLAAGCNEGRRDSKMPGSQLSLVERDRGGKPDAAKDKGGAAVRADAVNHRLNVCPTCVGPLVRRWGSNPAR